MTRALLPLLPALILAAPAAAQQVTQNTALCEGRVTLSMVETRPPAAPGGGLTAQRPEDLGNWTYWATFINTTPAALTLVLTITGDVGQRAYGARGLRPGVNPPIQLGVKPAGSFGAPLRGAALAQVIRARCE